VFIRRVVTGVAYMALSIPRLVPVEVVERLRTALRQRSMVTVARIKAVVHVAKKAVGAVKPGASPDKHPANKPIGPIVAVGSTVVRLIVEVPIRAHGGRPNVHGDGNLGWRQGCTA
jgi:hypothetical protein